MHGNLRQTQIIENYELLQVVVTRLVDFCKGWKLLDLSKNHTEIPKIQKIMKNPKNPKNPRNPKNLVKSSEIFFVFLNFLNPFPS